MTALTDAARKIGARVCAEDRVFRWLDRVRSWRRGGVILAFHHLPTSRFVDQVDSLQGYQIVPLSDLVRMHRAGRATGDLLAITFDDGVQDVTREVCRFARQRGWPVTCYLPTAYLDDPDALAFQMWTAVQAALPREVLVLPTRTLDLRDASRFASFCHEVTRTLYTKPNAELLPIVRELADHLVETRRIARAALHPPPPISWDEVATLSRDPLLGFESHAVSHQPLSALTRSELEAELRESQRRIEDCTGVACRHFCYPYGGAESIGTTAPVVARYYDSAVTMARGRIGGHAAELLPRVPVYEPDTGGVTRLKVLTA